MHPVQIAAPMITQMLSQDSDERIRALLRVLSVADLEAKFLCAWLKLLADKYAGTDVHGDMIQAQELAKHAASQISPYASALCMYLLPGSHLSH
jgi:hypothetical protein